jgi:anthranilate 1,2-dioxygenase small subunit
MKTALPPGLRDEIEQLHDDYAETADRLDIEAWPAFFTQDCLYIVTSRENHDAGLPHGTIYCEGLGMVQDRAAATRDCTVYEPRFLRHFIGRVKVDAVDGDMVRTRASVLVMESVSDKEPHVLIVGEYHDVLRRTPDGLKIKERRVVYDNFRIVNSLVFPV